MKKLWLGLALALVLPACGGDGGTYVKINFEQGTAPAQVARIHLDVTLGSGAAMAPLDLPGPITFPASKVLEIRNGEGAFMVTAIAFDGGNLEVARGTASGAVMRGETLGLTLRFGGDIGPDAGVDAGTDFAIMPGSADYGQVFAGLSSPDRTFMVVNGSTTATSALAVTVVGTGFTKGPDTCQGNTLAPGATCEVKVAFTPEAAGVHMGTLRVSDSGPPVRLATATLNGSAVTPPVLAVSPSMQTFPDVAAGTNGTDVTFTVTNTGGAPTGGLATVSSDPAQFIIANNNCSSRALASSEQCTLDVHFHPTSTGTKNATLTISATPGGMATAILGGNGLPGAVLAIAPSAHDFGVQLPGGQSTPFNFTVSNTGGVATGALGAAALANSTDFAIVSDGCMATVLMPGGSCTISARFQPATLGTKTSTLTVSSSPGGMDSASLTGTGQTAAAISTPSTQDFGSVALGSNTTVTIVVTNQGDAPTTPLTTTLAASEYTIVTNGCSAVTLAARASCSMQLRFTPTAAGVRPTALLQISATTGGTATVSMAGTGVAVGALTITPAVRDHGSSPVGAAGLVVTYTVRNTGSVATSALTTALDGSGAPDFRLSNDLCRTTTLAPTAMCTVDVTFSPLTRGSKTASLAVSGTVGGTGVATLTGLALSPASLVLLPTTFTFPGTPVAAMSASQSFTLRNTGDVASSLVTAALAGTNMSEFALAGNACTSTLAPGATCTIMVQFRPTSTGSKSAMLTASAGVTTSASLAGVGVPPAAIGFSPLSQSYGNVVLGQTGSQAFILTNSGDVATSGALVTSLTGADAAQFSLSANLCAGQTLQPGATCSVMVNFAPTTAGAKAASLSVVAGTTTGTAALSGTGIAPALLTVAPVTRDYMGVLVGATADQSFTVANTGGAPSGAVALAISGTDLTQFAIVAGGTCTSGTTTLAPAASCTTTVRFSPTTSGAKAARLTATASPGGAPFATLAGTGQTATLAAAVTSHDFGSQAVGTRSASFVWPVTNTGDAATGPVSATATSGFDVASSPCASVAAGATCMVSVSFLPTALGPQSGTITLSANPGGSVVLMVTGSGTPTATVSSLTAIPSVVAGCVPITAVVAQAQSLRSDLIVEFDPGTGTFQRATQGSSAPGSGEGAQGLTTSPAGVSHTFLWNTDADFSRTTVSNVRVRVSAAVSGQGGGAGAGVTQAGIAVRNGLAFAAPVNVGGSLSSQATAIGDLNGDGKLDLAVGALGGNVWVILGTGTGTFMPPVSYAAGTSPNAVAIDDLNGDGKLDIAAADFNGGLRVLIGNGNGTFMPSVSYAAGSSPSALAIGDVNRDGKPDVVVANYGLSGDVSVFLGTGTGTFGTAASFAVGTNARSVLLGDLNGDAKLDIVVGNTGSEDVSVLLGTGTGSFSAATSLTGPSPYAVAVADLDADGKLDLVIGSIGASSGIHVRRGNGDGTFQAGVYNPGSSSGLAVGDLDLDGKLDLVTVTGNGTHGYLLGRGDGTFKPIVDLVAGSSNATGVAIGDLDSDGKPDLAVSITTGLSFIANTTPTPCESQLPGVGSNAVGTSPIDVALGDLNADGKPDLVTANSGSNDISIALGRGDGSFVAAVTYPAGMEPHNVALRDLNGDGRLDVITANGASNNVSVLLGTGLGTVMGAASYPAGTSPSGLAVSDLNADGRADLVVPNSGSSNVSVLLGTGTGTFMTAVNYPVGTSPSGVAVADLNADTRIDLVVTNAGNDNVSVLLGNGNGTFMAAVNYMVGSSPREVVIADLNQDGRPDLGVANNNGGNVSVLLGTGAGTFTAADSYASGSSPYAIEAGDMNGDGRLDLVVVHDLSVALLIGTGTGTFPTSVQYAFGAGLGSTALGDVNGDGRPDVAAVSYGSNGFAMLLGSNGGTLVAAGRYIVGTSPRAAAIGDLNRDGKADVVAANFNSNNISVLLGSGSGGFPAAVNSATGVKPSGVVIEDVNGDGRPDVAVSNYGNNSVSVLLGNGNGTLQAPVNYPAGANPMGLASGDFNRDGKVDVVTVNFTGANVSVLIGSGTGTFAAPVHYAVLASPTRVVIADVNKDGKGDLVVNSFAQSSVSVLLGDGTGLFGAATNTTIDFGLSGVALGDLNRDGKLDLVVTLSDANNASVLLGTGTGGWMAPVVHPTESTPASVALADFNLDGKLDVVTGNQQRSSVSILLGNGSATLQVMANRGAAGFGNEGLAIGDLNRDGRPDVVVANSNQNSLGVLLGR